MYRRVMGSFKQALASVMVLLAALALNLGTAVEARQTDVFAEKPVVVNAESECGTERVLSGESAPVRVRSIADAVVRLTGRLIHGYASGATDTAAHARAWQGEADEQHTGYALSGATTLRVVTAADDGRENTEFQSMRISSMVNRETASGIYGSNAVVAFWSGGWDKARICRFTANEIRISTRHDVDERRVVMDDEL